MGQLMGGMKLGYQVYRESRRQSGFETRERNSSGRGIPVHPLASSPRPLRNIIVAGEGEGLGAGTTMGG